jgi:hypothetical protein
MAEKTPVRRLHFLDRTFLACALILGPGVIAAVAVLPLAFYTSAPASESTIRVAGIFGLLGGIVLSSRILAHSWPGGYVLQPKKLAAASVGGLVALWLASWGVIQVLGRQDPHTAVTPLELVQAEAPPTLAILLAVLVGYLLLMLLPEDDPRG